MTEGILQQLQLEAILGELAKRALRWSMAKASLQYSHSHYLRDGVSEVLIAGQETRVLEEDDEGWCYWSRCSYEVTHPLMRRNSLVNQVQFLGLVHAFVTM